LDGPRAQKKSDAGTKGNPVGRPRKLENQRKEVEPKKGPEAGGTWKPMKSWYSLELTPNETEVAILSDSMYALKSINELGEDTKAANG